MRKQVTHHSFLHPIDSVVERELPEMTARKNADPLIPRYRRHRTGWSQFSTEGQNKHSIGEPSRIRYVLSVSSRAEHCSQERLFQYVDPHSQLCPCGEPEKRSQAVLLPLSTGPL